MADHDHDRSPAADIVGGDKIAVGNIAGAQAVAIGRGAQAIVNITELSKSDRLDQRNRGILLSKIQDFWIDQVFIPSTRENEYILLDTEVDSRATINTLHEMQHAQGVAQHEQVMVGKTIAEVFEQLNRSMLVLGEAGSGKTTSLLGLTDYFVPLAAQDLNQPMPVILNLSSWRQGMPIAAWIVQELNGIYGVPRITAEQWLREASLLLLLDGLDEVSAKYRAECLQALNRFRDEWGLSPMAVCCREDVYWEINVKLKLSGAIRIRPLNSSQIERYIGEQLQPLRLAIANDNDLARLATNFLMLKLLVEATLAGKLDGLLALNTQQERVQFLLNAAHDEAVQGIGDAEKSYTLTSSDRWFAWLATRMTEFQQHVFLLERMQPSWLKLPERIVYTLILALILAPILYPLFWEIFYFPDSVVPIDVIVSASVALALATVAPIRPIQALRWSLGSLRRHAITMVPLAVGVGAAFGFLLDLSYAWENGQFDPSQLGIAVSAFAIAAAPIGLLLAGLQSEEVERTSSPNQGIKRSGIYAVIVAAAFAAVASALLLLIYGDNYAQVVAIPAGLYYGGLAFLQHFVLRAVLIIFQRTPVRYVKFLNEAAGQNVLRRVGGGYIFAHRSLMQHFADLSDKDDLARRASHHEESELSITLAALTPAPTVPAQSPTGLAGNFVPAGYRMDVRVLDFTGDEDLLRQINKYLEDNGITFATILGCTGTLSHVMIRHREQTEPIGIAGHLRIASISAVLHQPNGSEAYIVVSDEKGALHGGLLQEGSRVLGSTQVLLGVLQP